jgi:hypothetical protein
MELFRCMSVLSQKGAHEDTVENIGEISRWDMPVSLPRLNTKLVSSFYLEWRPTAARVVKGSMLGCPAIPLAHPET